MVRGLAYRITQRDRILKKRRQNTKSRMKEHTYDNHLIDTPKRCSCHMCCNPRRNDYIKKKEKLTIAERKFEEKFQSEIEEL